jgi:hypothetical protein
MREQHLISQSSSADGSDQPYHVIERSTLARAANGQWALMLMMVKGSCLLHLLRMRAGQLLFASKYVICWARF